MSDKPSQPVADHSVTDHLNVDHKVACNACMKEIPVSEAHSGEADDYVRHFCGLDCYDKWRAQEHKTGEMAHPDDD